MRKMSFVLLSFVLLAVLIGCSSTKKDASKETTFERAKKESKVTVGFANEKPFAYTAPDGKLTGESVEVARAILKKLGINEMEGVLTEFGTMIPGLKANRFDMITAALYITKKRQEEVSFANPDFYIGEAIAVRKGNPLNIHSYDDIKANPKVKIAVMGGSMEYEFLNKLGVPDSQIEIVPDMPSSLAAIQAGRVDVITDPAPVLQDLLNTAKDDNLERVMDFKQPLVNGVPSKSYGGVVFRKEDNDFREAFNKGLKELEDSGELLKIMEPFGFMEEDLPKGMTADEVLKQ